jgi:ABC-type branched-subunit amino acid transport system ATPase component
MVKRVKLSFVPGLEVEFVDRNSGIQQILEWSEKSTWHPVVVFGPEGCGKSAWLRQATEILRDMEFDVMYVNPMYKEFTAHTDVKEVVAKEFAKINQQQRQQVLEKLRIEIRSSAIERYRQILT